MRHSPACKFAFTVACLSLLVWGPTVHAAPVTGWVTTNGEADFEAETAATESPVTTRADGDAIAANFDALTLSEVGQAITLTGSVTFDVAIREPQQFRWGLFAGENPVAADDGAGYVGVWASAGSGDNSLARADGIASNPFAGSAATAITTTNGGNLKADSPITFSMTIERISESEIAVSASAKATRADNEAVVLQWEQTTTSASPRSFTYDRVAFLLGGQLDGTKATFSNIEVAAGEASDSANQEAGGHRYLTPEGAGSRNGTSWDDAYPATALQQGWDQLGPGDTLHIGSGTYAMVTLTLDSGGTDADRPKTLLGVDTGEGLPVFVSDWDRDDPARGQTLIIAEKDVDHWRIQDIIVQRYRSAVVGRGMHEGVRIINVDVNESRDAIVLYGGAPDDQPERGTNDVLIKDCDLIHFTKRGVRLRGGVYNAKVVNCVADAGGQAYATERFQIGFEVQGDRAAAPDHNITFVDCVGRNAYDDQGDEYWNGDGFTAERNTHSIRYEGCEAYDNTDGGFDVKSPGAVFMDCIALRNKRNFRIWSHEQTTMINCLGAYARHPGGIGGPTGLHLTRNAIVQAEHLTLAHNDGSGVLADEDGAQLTFDKSILMTNDPSAILIKLAPAASVEINDTTLWDDGSENDDPHLINPHPDWNGQGDAFNSRRYSQQRGFHQARRMEQAER